MPQQPDEARSAASRLWFQILLRWERTKLAVSENWLRFRGIANDAGVPGHPCSRCGIWTVLEFAECAVCDPMGESRV